MHLKNTFQATALKVKELSRTIYRLAQKLKKFSRKNGIQGLFQDCVNPDWLFTMNIKLYRLCIILSKLQCMLVHAGALLWVFWAIVQSLAACTAMFHQLFNGTVYRTLLVYVLQIKIELRLKSFNLHWFSIYCPNSWIIRALRQGKQIQPRLKTCSNVCISHLGTLCESAQSPQPYIL